MVQAILLKPLDGQEIGATVEMSQIDFDRLEKKGAVAKVKSASAPQNKMEAAPKNKAAPKRAKKVN